MKNSQIAYQLQVLFAKKITDVYRNSYKGIFGKVQVEVLDYLYEYPNTRTQDVADALIIPKQHASKILLRLIELGLVEKKEDSNDKRAHLFCLSETGKKLVEEHIALSDANFDKLVQKLSKEEEKEFVESMKSIVSILEKL